MTLCRRCGIALTHEATIAMGICGACLLACEGMPSVLPRPRYGQDRTPDTPPPPRIE